MSCSENVVVRNPSGRAEPVHSLIRSEQWLATLRMAVCRLPLPRLDATVRLFSRNVILPPILN